MAGRRRKSTMVLQPSTTALVALGISFTTCGVVAQTGSCFTTLGAINSEMQTELARIQNGATPKESYVFNLCANTFFDATSEPLMPVLNNAMFVCGDNGSRSNRCVVVGGSQQVRITDSLVSGFPLQEVHFLGITFSAFLTDNQMTGTSIAAFASSATTATFSECTWQEFMSDFVVLQRSQDSGFGSMTVEIERGIVTSGTAGSVFSNDGGLLRINELDVVDLTATALIATASNGASFLEGSTISLSDVNSVTYTTAGGSQSVLGTSVSQMRRIDDAFYVESIGSTLLLEGTTIEQNRIQTNPWSAVSARTGSIARVAETSIADNASVEFGIVSFDSSITVTDSFISGNVGMESSGTTSAPVFAITDANISLERVEFNGNTDFSGFVVALIRSNVRIARSCFKGGSAEFVVFIANDGDYEQMENYIDDVTSQRCGATGPRLFKEEADSGCFLGSSVCEGMCLEVADQDSCLAQDVPTRSPMITTLLPTKSPSPPLSLVPITLAPTLTPVKIPTTIMPVTAAPLSSAPVPSAPVEIPTSLAPVPLRTIEPTEIHTKSPTRAPFVTVSPVKEGVPTRTPVSTSVPTKHETPTVQPAPAPTISPVVKETSYPTITQKPTGDMSSSKQGSSKSLKDAASKRSSQGGKGQSKRHDELKKKSKVGDGSKRRDIIAGYSKKQGNIIIIMPSNSSNESNGSLAQPSALNGATDTPHGISIPVPSVSAMESNASEPANTRVPAHTESSKASKPPSFVPLALNETTAPSTTGTPMPSVMRKSSKASASVVNATHLAGNPINAKASKKAGKEGKPKSQAGSMAKSKESHIGSTTGGTPDISTKGKVKKQMKGNKIFQFGKHKTPSVDDAVSGHAELDGADAKDKADVEDGGQARRLGGHLAMEAPGGMI